MSDWKNNSMPDYTKGIAPDYCELGDAPLILMNIAIHSNLGAALKKIDDRIDVQMGCRDLDQIIDGQKLLSTRIKDILFKNKWYFPYKEFSCEADEAYFVHLIKVYLEILDALSESAIVRKSPNVFIKNRKPGTLYKNTEILIVEVIEWAIKKKIPIDEGLLVAYSMELPAKVTELGANKEPNGGGSSINDNKRDEEKKIIEEERKKIKTFLEGIKSEFPLATSKDLFSHCFKCYEKNTREKQGIKKIMVELKIEIDKKSGKRCSEKKKNMEKAPIFTI